MVDDACVDESRYVGEAKFVVNDKSLVVAVWGLILISFIVITLCGWGRHVETLSEDRQEGKND